MKKPHAVALAAAVLTHTALAERRHRQRMTLAAATMHQRGLADLDENPYREDVRSADGQIPFQDFEQVLHFDRLILLLMVRHRLGLLSRAALRASAAQVMTHERGRLCWERRRDISHEQAADGTDREFNTIMDAAFAAAEVDRALTDAGREPGAEA
ncbi:DUF6082 family protein [Streptomyces sp. NPDC048636]|uniref:DUF6082 family protein n=1 Tax=Streptomyces sp. NPDC048636 TaxID=3155762 RepID=UPI003413A97D